MRHVFLPRNKNLLSETVNQAWLKLVPNSINKKP